MALILGTKNSLLENGTKVGKGVDETQERKAEF